MEPKPAKKLGELVHEYISSDDEPALVTFHEATDVAKKIINSKRYKEIKRFGERFDSLNNGGYGIVFNNKEVMERFYIELQEELN